MIPVGPSASLFWTSQAAVWVLVQLANSIQRLVDLTVGGVGCP